MNEKLRIESDSMGEMQVPSAAYYGAQTARAIENFPISEIRFPPNFIRALALIKQHAAAVNCELGLLTAEKSAAIQAATREVIEGKWQAQFPLDIFQTGSGTSTNMNANEVIANRAAELMGLKPGGKSVHPNDDVNRCQSSNDVIPSAIHIAVWEGLVRDLVPALGELTDTLEKKASEFDDVLKIGRTHLQDATPIRLGQEFSGYARQIELAAMRIKALDVSLTELALGGTAVGTGINAHPEFAKRTIAKISQDTGLSFREAKNHFSAQASIDGCVAAASALKGVALSFIKIANDIRWMGSGPRCGLGELRLPATQPGSSIMPGKVNPVMCEMVIQVGAQVLGNEAVVAFSATQGFLDLNTMLPVVARNLLESISILSNASRIFSRRCVAGIEADVEACAENIEQSLAMCTALAPEIGYDKAAKIAKTAYETGRTVREVAIETSGLSKKRLDELLDPRSQTEPGLGSGSSAG